LFGLLKRVMPPDAELNTQKNIGNCVAFRRQGEGNTYDPEILKRFCFEGT